MNHGHFQGDADDPHQVNGGNQGAQDGPDTQRLAFAGVDELQAGGTSFRSVHEKYVTSRHGKSIR